MRKYTLVILLGFTMAFLFLAAFRISLTSIPHYPPVSEFKKAKGSAVEDLYALSFGMRRLSADLWFIRLIQYYGTREQSVTEGDGHDAGHGHPGHICEGEHFGEGAYPEFTPMSRHLLTLDPYFVSAGLYSAGSLAFNLGRAEEAVSLLKYALIHNPKEWKFVTLLAAIGYSKAKKPADVIKIIKPLLTEPDCPVMIRQLAAFLNKKAGNFPEALTIYKIILATTKDPFYLQNAKKEIAQLESKRVLL